MPSTTQSHASKDSTYSEDPISDSLQLAASLRVLHVATHVVCREVHTWVVALVASVCKVQKALLQLVGTKI